MKNKKPSRIEKLSLIGYSMKIVEREGMLATDGRSGSYAPLRDEIHIDGELTDQKFISTIVHEIGEVIVERYGLASTISHDVLTILMEAITQSLQSNPHLLKKMLEVSTKNAKD